MAKPYVPHSGRVVTRAEAEAAGLTRFFTGRSCRHGHLSERMITNGACSYCLLLRSDAWQRANPERMRQAIATWTEANIEYVRARGRRYSKEHQPQSAAHKRARRARRFAEKMAARVPDPLDYTGPVISREEAKAAGISRFFTGKPCINNHLSQRTTANGGCFRCNTELGNQLYHNEAPEERKARRALTRAWKKAHPEAVKAEAHRRRALKLTAEGSHTAGELKALFQRQRGKCAYCVTSIRDGYHVDHVVALANGGSNWISNIALACAPCNLSKGAVDPIEFARRNGRLI